MIHDETTDNAHIATLRQPFVRCVFLPSWSRATMCAHSISIKCLNPNNYNTLMSATYRLMCFSAQYRRPISVTAAHINLRNECYTKT